MKVRLATWLACIEAGIPLTGWLRRGAAKKEES